MFKWWFQISMQSVVLIQWYSMSLTTYMTRDDSTYFLNWLVSITLLVTITKDFCHVMPLPYFTLKSEAVHFDCCDIMHYNELLFVCNKHMWTDDTFTYMSLSMHAHFNNICRVNVETGLQLGHGQSDLPWSCCVLSILEHEFLFWALQKWSLLSVESILNTSIFKYFTYLTSS